jgi:hypothetical protein
MSKPKPTSKAQRVNQYITLDCAPGNPRPDDLYPKVIEGLNLPKREAQSKFFGQFIWDYSDISRDRWLLIQPILKERITRLYNQGLIRYGDW